MCKLVTQLFLNITEERLSISRAILYTYTCIRYKLNFINPSKMLDSLFNSRVQLNLNPCQCVRHYVISHLLIPRVVIVFPVKHAPVLCGNSQLNPYQINQLCCFYLKLFYFIFLSRYMQLFFERSIVSDSVKTIFDVHYQQVCYISLNLIVMSLLIIRQI